MGLSLSIVLRGRAGYDAPELWPWLRASRPGAPSQAAGGPFDLTRFNEAYFDRLRVLIRCADANNIVVVIQVHDGWTRQQKHQFYLKRFCERLLQATADTPNVMFEIFNEGEWYDAQRLRAFQMHFLPVQSTSRMDRKADRSA